MNASIALSSFAAKNRPGLHALSQHLRADRAADRVYAPRVLAVPERNVLERRVHELVLRAFSRLLSHAREPERVEHFRVWVHCLVVGCCISRGGEERALGDERPVAERHVLERHV